LDGTTNFIHGLAPFCTSIALKRNDEIILGVISEPNLKETFYAWVGSQAFLNGKPITVSDTDKLDNALLATGFPYYDYSRLENYMQVFEWCMRNSRGVRRLGSAAMDLAYVACGRMDGFYEYGLKPWDVAAGSFIVQQAGGKISDFSGDNNFLFGQEIIAFNGKLHDEFVEVMGSFF
jgi:myo-inositol-1(or 4)-monophosphatase